MLVRRYSLPAVLGLALGLTSIALAGDAAKAPPRAENWAEARVALRAAANMATRGEYRAADGYLDYYRGRLDAPYGTMIVAARKRIAALGKQSGSLDAYELKGRCARLCMDFGAYRTALKLAGEIRELKPDDPAGHSGHLGWCLLELGRVKEAERERKKSPSSVDEKQLTLAARMYSGETGASVLLAFVKEHCIRDRGDRLGALDRLTVALQKPHRGKARLDIYAGVFEQFRELNDPDGLLAWENRLLKDFPRDSAARSVVHMARAEGAGAKKNYDLAVAELAEVMSGEVRESATGELARAFVARRHRAAMLASDYCERKKDYVRAHGYALAARDHYKPWKRSGAKAAIALRRLNVRIRKLAAKLDQAGTSSSPSP